MTTADVLTANDDNGKRMTAVARAAADVAMVLTRHWRDVGGGKLDDVTVTNDHDVTPSNDYANRRQQNDGDGVK